MGYCKRTLHKLLFPGLAVVIASIPVAAALLSYTFLFGEEDGPIAYFSYAISAYSLAIVCAQAVKLLKGTCKALLYRNKYLHRYLTEVPFKMWISLYLSLGINLLYAVAKLFGGAYYRSVWFGTLAVYYMLLAIMRFLLLTPTKEIRTPFSIGSMRLLIPMAPLLRTSFTSRVEMLS